MTNYKASTNTYNNINDNTGQTNKKKQRKMDQPRLFTLKHDLLKVSVDLQTAFAAETPLAEWRWLKEQSGKVT
jgi:hypothetical protein